MTSSTARSCQRMCRMLCAAWMMALALTTQSSAQVVIDMPAPPARQPAPSLTAAAPAVAPTLVAATTQQIDVGELALNRYSRGRTLPFDTYWNGPMYAGYQQYNYSYPWFWWGGFWPFWGGCCFNVCP